MCGNNLLLYWEVKRPGPESELIRENEQPGKEMHLIHYIIQDSGEGIHHAGILMFEKENHWSK